MNTARPRFPLTTPQRLRHWSREQGMGSLAGSVLLHLGTAALIFVFAHRFWPGAVSSDGLVPTQDGGAMQSGIPVKSRLSVKPQSARARPAWVLAPAPAELAFPREEVLRKRADFHALPNRQGAGWNGGYGMGLAHGEGSGFWGGSGTGFTSQFLGCVSAQDRKSSPFLQGDNVVIVLDLSGSTRDRDASRATVMRELRESLAHLRPHADFNVVCFARQTATLARAGIRVSPENIAGALAFVEALHQDPGTLLDREGNVPEGSSGTSRLDAGLLAAIKGGADEVLLISDGNTVAREGGRGLSHREILARLHRVVPEDESSPTIHTVCVQPQGSDFLRQVAKEFTGRYRQ